MNADLVDALLERIGLQDRPAPDVEGLRAVHRAYVGAVPYEVVGIQLGEPLPLDVGAVAERMLSGGRGGYCFELNGVLGALLEELGFTLTRHRCVAGEVGCRAAGDPVNHLVLVVECGGRRWLADAGLGEGWTEPLPFEPGVQRAGAFSWTISEEDDGWWVAHHRWGSFKGISIEREPAGLDAFEEPHRRLSTSPESSFVQTLVVERPLPDRLVRLRSRTLKVDGPAVPEEQVRVLGDAAELAAVLQGEFGIDPRALGAGRVERLWEQARAQHERWLREQAAVSP